MIMIHLEKLQFQLFSAAEQVSVSLRKGGRSYCQSLEQAIDKLQLGGQMWCDEFLNIAP